MAKVPGMSKAQSRFKPKLEKRFAVRGIAGALYALREDRDRRVLAGNPMTKLEYEARQTEIITRGKALLQYRLAQAAGFDVHLPDVES